MSKAYLEPEEIRSLENAATNLRDRLLIRLLSRLGCRISEALGLHVEDIDFKKGTITIEHLKTRLRLACPQCNARLGKGTAFCPKCGLKVDQTVAQARDHRRVRTLPVDSETLKILGEYIERGGPVSRDGQLVVFGIGRGQGWRIIAECARRAGLETLVNPDTGKERGISPHRLRDAFAIRAMKRDDSGDGLRLLQEHLGHASFNTTARYRKVSGEESKEWYGNLWEDEERKDGA